MKTTPVRPEDLSRSVLAVPPLARNADLSLNEAANRRMIAHLERGGVTTLLYGGNANLYNIRVSEFARTCEFLAEAASAESWIIPSVGPDYGKLMDQAQILRDTKFPTAMVLPLTFPAHPDGTERGVRAFVETFGRPIILYVKFDGYVEPAHVARLVDDGLVCGIKYATVRKDPAEDAYLTELVKVVDRKVIVSGIGERPAIVHLRDFGLNGFTSGSVCVAPHASTAILKALKAKDYETAAAIRERFLPLEDLRDGLSPIRVLHEAVSLSGIADMGPILPLLANIEEKHRPAIRQAARDLLAYDESLESEGARATA